jgi:hypothetical protein
MFTRLRFALTALALLAACPLIAGERETRRTEALRKFRDLCITVASRSSDPAAKSQATRFLQLSRLRSWSNHSGKTIHAIYLGHGTNSQGESIIYLETPDGSQYGIKPGILSSETRRIADELGLLVPAIGRAANRLEGELQARVRERERAQQEPEPDSRARVGASATFAEYSHPTPIYPTPLLHPTWYRPYLYWYGGYTISPYNPWARGPYSVVVP